MAPIGTIQLAGNANAGPSEVELNTLAARIVSRPHDFSYLGSYRLGQSFTVCSSSSITGSISYAVPTNYIVFSFFLPTSGAIAVVRRVNISATQFLSTARQHTLNLVRATNYTAACLCVLDNGVATGENITCGKYEMLSPTKLVPSKLRGFAADSVAKAYIPASPINAGPIVQNGTFKNGLSFLMDYATAQTQLQTASPANGAATDGFNASIQIANIQDNNGTTGYSTIIPPFLAEGQGNRVIDSRPINSITFPISAAGGGIGNTTLLDNAANVHPLVLSGLTGFEIQWTASSAPALNERVDLSVDMYWDELQPTW